MEGAELTESGLCSVLSRGPGLHSYFKPRVLEFNIQIAVYL